jgi:hypothetical protein
MTQKYNNYMRKHGILSDHRYKVNKITNPTQQQTT